MLCRRGRIVKLLMKTHVWIKHIYEYAIKLLIKFTLSIEIFWAMCKEITFSSGFPEINRLPFKSVHSLQCSFYSTEHSFVYRLFNIFIYLYLKGRFIERRREKVFLHLLTPQMAATVWAELIWSQVSEVTAFSGSPTWALDPKDLAYSLIISQATHIEKNEKWSSQDRVEDEPVESSCWPLYGTFWNL